MARYAKGFQGNINIRPAGAPIEWTPETLSEFRKCASDPFYFIETYVKIRSLDSEELIPFIPRAYQVEMLRKMIDERYCLCKLPRQAGKTLLVSAALLWFTIFNMNYSILVAAHKGDKARDVLTSIKNMYENLPDFLQHGVIEYNKGNILLENGSKIRATATSGSAARGDTVNFCYLDEAAFIPTHVADEFFKSVIPTISSGQTSKIFITSTPKGLNHFYRMAMAAKNKTSGYAYVEINWNDVPGRDEKFKAGIIAQYGEDFWRQEFNTEWLGSSRTLISGPKLASLVTEKPLRESEHARTYSDPTEGRAYVMTVDVSEGLGADYSAMVVFDVTELPYRPAAVYRNNHIDPMQLPAAAHELATRYNDALVLVEANFGQQVGEILYSDYEYENMVFTTKGKSGPQAKVDKISSGYSGRSRVGLAWNAHSKRVGCSNLKTLVEQDQLIVIDEWIYDELVRFSVKGKSYAAEDGHDDLAMCLVMFAWMVDQGYVRDSTDVSVRDKIARLNAEAIERDMMPLGFNSMNHEDIEMIIMERPEFPIDVPDPESGDYPFHGLFDRETARGGMSEQELHDSFIREFFNA